MPKKLVRITMESDARNEVLEGRAFMGTMLNMDENQTIAVGALSPSVIREVTTANIAAFMTISMERQRDPEEMYNDINKMMLVAVQTAMEHRKSEVEERPMSSYDFQFLKATIEFAEKMMSVTEL